MQTQNLMLFSFELMTLDTIFVFKICGKTWVFWNVKNLNIYMKKKLSLFRKSEILTSQTQHFKCSNLWTLETPGFLIARPSTEIGLQYLKTPSSGQIFFHATDSFQHHNLRNTKLWLP